MSFFDRTKQTISTTSKSFAAKAKEMAEISNLNGQINVQQDTIRSAYMELGKIYYELHQEEPDEECAIQCATIADAIEQIEQLQEQIRKTKGIEICVNCHCEIPLGAKFCPNCGTKVEEPEESAFIEEEYEDIANIPEEGMDTYSDVDIEVVDNDDAVEDNEDATEENDEK